MPWHKIDSKIFMLPILATLGPMLVSYVFTQWREDKQD